MEDGAQFCEDAWEKVGGRGEDVQEDPACGGDGVGGDAARSEKVYQSFKAGNIVDLHR